MRRLFWALLLLVIATLAACNPGISSDAAARGFINGLFSGNMAAARDTLCERAKPLLDGDSEAILQALPDMQVDVSELSYSVRDATDTTATVVVSGPVRIGSGEGQQEADFASIGGSLTTLPAVVEDSAWKICPTDLTLS